VLLFAASAGLAQAFVREMERRTWLTLRLVASPAAILLGKWGVNLALLLATEMIVVPLFLVLFGASFASVPAFLAVLLLASVGLTQNDVNIQSVGPTGVWEFVATGKSVGMAGVPDWIPPVQAAGVKVKVIQTDEYFPHMAQGIAASDQVIKDRPEMVRKFVKAALHGMKDMMDDPDKAADDFVRFVPEWKGKEGGVKFAFNMYAKLVYPGQKELGEVNADRVAKLQEFYVAKGFIQKATPVDELYTNAFIK
jgi:NitT/TauT family transport system substrate-binding protein